jgi:glycosyltransferase involved in cell wall biosynthesis
MTKSPSVSIGLPVYNGEKHLGESIQSILSQDFSDFELIISDNASTDSTCEICRSFAAHDSRIRLHQNQKDLGAATNFELVFKMARAPYFMWWADDDFLVPRYVAECYEFLTAHIDYVICCSRMRIVDRSGEEIFESTANFTIDDDDSSLRFAKLLKMLPTATPMYGLMRRSALPTSNQLFRRIPGSDQAFLLELILKGKFKQLDKVMLHRRKPIGRSSLHEQFEFYEMASRRQLGNAKGFRFPHTRLALAFFSVVCSKPFSFWQKLRLAALLIAGTPFSEILALDFFLFTYGFPKARRLTNFLYRLTGDCRRAFWAINLLASTKNNRKRKS